MNIRLKIGKLALLSALSLLALSAYGHTGSGGLPTTLEVTPMYPAEGPIIDPILQPDGHPVDPNASRPDGADSQLASNKVTPTVESGILAPRINSWSPPPVIRNQEISPDHLKEILLGLIDIGDFDRVFPDTNPSIPPNTQARTLPTDSKELVSVDFAQWQGTWEQPESAGPSFPPSGPVLPTRPRLIVQLNQEEFGLVVELFSYLNEVRTMAPNSLNLAIQQLVEQVESGELSAKAVTTASLIADCAPSSDARACESLSLLNNYFML